jgi:hypothetical protein
MEDEARDLRPIRPLRVGVKDAQIRDEVLFVIAGQNICVRSGVGHRWIEWRLRHEASYAPNQMIVPRDHTGDTADDSDTRHLSTTTRSMWPATCSPPRIQSASPNWLGKPVTYAIPIVEDTPW